MPAPIGLTYVKTSQIFISSALVGLLTMAFDLAFHACCTSPMETPLYFVAKFSWGFIAALVAFAIPSVLLGAFFGGILFDILVGYYYLAFLTQNPLLSCCTINAPEVFGIKNTTPLINSNFYPISFGVLAFIFVHFIVFFIAFLLVALMMQKRKR